MHWVSYYPDFFKEIRIFAWTAPFPDSSGRDGPRTGRDIPYLRVQDANFPGRHNKLIIFLQSNQTSSRETRFLQNLGSRLMGLVV